MSSLHLPSIMDKLFIKVKDEPTLLQVIEEHINELKARVNHDFSYSTYEKYVFTYDKVKAFIQNSLKRKDILLRDVAFCFLFQ
jgi:hypothetical protein